MPYQGILIKVCQKLSNEAKVDTIVDFTLCYYNDSNICNATKRKKIILIASSINCNKRNFIIHSTCVQCVHNQESTYVPSLFVKLNKSDFFLGFVELEVFDCSKTRGWTHQKCHSFVPFYKF